MDVIGQLLDARDDQDPIRSADWMTIRNAPAPEVRLLAFDRWVKERLAEQLDWAWAGKQKEKRIEQCRIRLEAVVLELWRRGWMLDGRALAVRIIELLDLIAAYQRKGAVVDFWAYFEACVRRYVGANAEEIREEAMRAGSHVSQALAAVTSRRVSLPELVAQRADEISTAKAEKLREKLARARAREKAENDQPTLL